MLFNTCCGLPRKILRTRVSHTWGDPPGLGLVYGCREPQDSVTFHPTIHLSGCVCFGGWQHHWHRGVPFRVRQRLVALDFISVVPCTEKGLCVHTPQPSLGARRTKGTLAGLGYLVDTSLPCHWLLGPHSPRSHPVFPSSRGLCDRSWSSQ